MKEDSTKIVSVGQIDIGVPAERPTPDFNDLPIIAMRDLVLFPGVTFPITLARDASVMTAAAAAENHIPVGIFCQREASTEHPGLEDLYEYGVVADVLKTFDLPDGTHTAILSAREKIKITGMAEGRHIPGALAAQVKSVRESSSRQSDKEFIALVDDIRQTTLNILHAGNEKMSDLAFNIENIPSPQLLINIISTHSPFTPEVKIELLRKNRMKDRAQLLLSHLAHSEEMAEIRADVHRKARRNIDEQQRNAFLQHQFEVLREELYGDDDDCRTLEEKAKKMGLPVKKTPSLEAIKDEIPDDVQNHIQRLYSKGQHYRVHSYIADVIKKEKIPCLEEYMKERESLKTFKGSVITTHRYLTAMDEKRLNEFDAVIIDEDIIFKSALTGQCEIPLSKLKKLESKTTNSFLKKKVRKLLSHAKDESCIELISFDWDEEDDKKYIEGKHPLIDIAAFCSAEKFYIRKKENGENVEKDTVVFLKPILFHNMKYIMVSATADERICREFFYDRKIEFYKCKKARYEGVLKQYPGRSMSRSSIASDPDVVSRLMEKFNLDESRVITFKNQDIGQLHFGNTEGSNTLEGEDILVVGTPYHADFIYKLAAFTMDMDFDEDEKMVPQTVTYNGYRFRFTTYKNENLRAIHFWMIESELEQAVGRARLLRNSCEVHLFSNFILSQAEIVEDFDYNKKY